jgi:hypothetical protein
MHDDFFECGVICRASGGDKIERSGGGHRQRDDLFGARTGIDTIGAGRQPDQ